MSSKRSRRHALPSNPGPRQKHAKYEHRDTLTDSRMQLSGNLEAALGKEDRLDYIHTFVTTHIGMDEREAFGDRILSTKDQFKAVVQHERLLELARKAVSQDATNDDYDALLQYGTCFCYGIDQFTNII